MRALAQKLNPVGPAVREVRGGQSACRVRFRVLDKVQNLNLVGGTNTTASATHVMAARPAPRRSARLAPLPWSFNKRLLKNKQKRLEAAARRALERPRLVGDALTPRAPEADTTTRSRSRSGARRRQLHAPPRTTPRGAPAAGGATRTMLTGSLVRILTALGYAHVRTQAELQAKLNGERYDLEDAENLIFAEKTALVGNSFDVERRRAELNEQLVLISRPLSARMLLFTAAFRELGTLPPLEDEAEAEAGAESADGDADEGSGSEDGAARAWAHAPTPPADDVPDERDDESAAQPLGESYAGEQEHDFWY